MSDMSKCEKCGEETYTTSLYRLNDKLYCHACLPLVRCDGCGVNTYGNAGEGPGGKRYCSICLTSICNETGWKTLRAMMERFEIAMGPRHDRDVEADPLPEHPSRHLRIKLPFITIAIDETDGMVEMMGINRYSEFKQQEQMQIGGFINWITNFVRDRLDPHRQRPFHPKCDGDHAEPACSDPQCWRRS